jgi:hypothetical protein
MTIFSKFIPIPEPIQNKSRVGALKKRLDWGEPALTIIDVRTSRELNKKQLFANSQSIDRYTQSQKVSKNG